MPIYGDAEKIVQEVLARAKKEAEDLTRRSLELRERRLKAAQEEILKPQAQANAKLQATKERRRILASAGLAAKRMVLDKKEELVEDVFSQVAQKVEELRMSRSYPEIVFRLVSEAASALGEEELIVEFDKADAHIFTRKFQKDIANRLSRKLHFSQSDIPGGGVILKSTYAIFDNSFPARLQRLRGQLRGEILEILLGKEH